MNEVILPLAPNWYLFSTFDCASDNTVVYGCRGDIIIINPKDPTEAADIKKIHKAHHDRVTAISLNHGNWNDPDKLVASCGEEGLIRVWDLNTLSSRMYHNEHQKRQEKVVGVSLVNDRVISVSENGVIVIYRLSTKIKTTLKDLFPPKIKVKCMLSCPHASWMSAFGFSNGLITVVDLKRGKVLYKMRGGECDVLALSWCPIPINIFKTEAGIKIETILKMKNGSNRDKIVPKVENTESKAETVHISKEKDDILDVDIPEYNMDDRKSCVYKKVDKKNPWGNIQFEDSVPDTSQLEDKEVDSDYLKECISLKNKIENKTPEPQEHANVELEENDTKRESKFKTLLERNLNEEESNFSNVEELKTVSDGSSIEIEVPKRFISQDSNKEYLLAVGLKDGNIQIWRALTDGRMQLNLSKFFNIKKKNYNDKWIAVKWAKPDLLFFSSQKSRVYSCDLLPDVENDGFKQLFKPRLVHDDHSNQIFHIGTPYKIYSELEKTDSSLDEFFIWTFGMDKSILCTTVGKKRITIASYPCLSSIVCAMAVSPIDPTKLAIGLNDSAIRVWDLSVPHLQVISIKTLIDNKRDKITALAWHPVKENCLAYATGDGQVVQLITNNKKLTKFHQYHTDCVYAIQWVPIFDKENEFALYSCSYGQLIYHDESYPDTEPNKIELDEGHVYNFAWNSDYSILAVGTKEGYVKLLTNSFETYETLYVQKKSIRCLTWHPESTFDDTCRSPYANYLAVSTNELNIVIYNCNNFQEKCTGKKSSLVAVLEGHTGGVKFLAWCPLIGGRLVSGCEDGLVMVWDVVTQTILSTYKYSGKDIISSLLWSPLDADLIIVGYKDLTVQIFRITKHPPMTFEPENKIKKKSSSKLLDTDNAVTSVESVPPEKQKRTFVLTSISKLQNPQFNDNMATCRKILQTHDEPDNKIDENYENDSSEDESDKQPDTISVDSSNIDVAQLFGTRKDMIDILNYEQEKHRRNLQWENMHHISLWRGDLAKSIEKALKSGVIEPWIINMAPMVSHELWSKLCLQYAEKLADEGHGLEASSYFIACHQIHKAIDALCSSNLHREALALAKCRLPPDDPLINHIYERWATYTNNVGNYEVAVQCYIKLGKFSDAATLLNKRTELEKLELALELAKRSNNHDLEVAINAKLELLNQQKQLSSPETEIDAKSQVVDISQSRLEALMAVLDKTKIDDDDNAHTIENDITDNKLDVNT